MTKVAGVGGVSIHCRSVPDVQARDELVEWWGWRQVEEVRGVEGNRDRRVGDNVDGSARRRQEGRAVAGWGLGGPGKSV